VVNGNGIANGDGTESRPRTPSLNTLSLTEYSTNPSPPSQSPRSKIRGVIPDEFILPNGYPDVRFPNLLIQFISNGEIVSAIDPHVKSLRSRQRNTTHPRHESEQSIRMQSAAEERGFTARV
jgi:hypothetical protein